MQHAHACFFLLLILVAINMAQFLPGERRASFHEQTAAPKDIHDDPCWVKPQGASPTVKNRVNVVDGHGDALSVWMSELLSEGSDTAVPYDLLHIDSHSDMVVDLTIPMESLEPVLAWSLADLRGYINTREKLKGMVSIANFIPLGILNGLVENVIWMRSDFPYGYYNGPEPGHINVNLNLSLLRPLIMSCVQMKASTR